MGCIYFETVLDDFLFKKVGGWLGLMAYQPL